MAHVAVRALTASLVAVGLLVGRTAAQSVPRAAGTAGRAATPDAVLSAYLAGDSAAIDRLFKTSVDFQNRLRLNEPERLDRWLGEFEPRKAVFILSLAQSSAVVARQYTPVLLSAGARYVDGNSRRNARPGAPTEFARAWHRAAIAVLQGVQNFPAVDAHLAGIASRARTDVMSAPRLLLAPAMVHEQKCWVKRPSLDVPSLRVDALAKLAGAVGV